MSSMLTFRAQYLDDRDPFSTDAMPAPLKPILYTFHMNRTLDLQIGALHQILNAPQKLEDCTIQLYKPDRWGPYLDIESTLNDQWKEIEEFYDGAKCLFLLRTQPRVRVQAIIRQLRREAENDDRSLSRRLIWLKQIFMSDQDVIHEFVESDGLKCLIDIGNAYNQYRTHILRAMNKMILYVDGMTGFIEHTEVIQWLYSILETPEQVVLTMTLKLLIIFVEYSESNASIFIDVAHLIDRHDGKTPFFRLTELLRVQRNPEIMHLCMALINRTIAAIPDQDTFYDVTDWLECQGMQKIVERLINEFSRYNSKEDCITNLLTQLNVYEAALKLEDGDITNEDTCPSIKGLLGRKDRLKSAVPRTSLRRQAMTGSLVDLTATTSDMSDAEGSLKRSHRLNFPTSNKHIDRWASDVEASVQTPPPGPSITPRRSAQFKNLHNRWEVSTTAQIPQKAPRTIKSYLTNEAARVSGEIAKSVAKSAAAIAPKQNALGGIDESSPPSPPTTSITVEKHTRLPQRPTELFTAKQPNEIRRVDVRVGERCTGLVNRAKDSLAASKAAAVVGSHDERALNAGLANHVKLHNKIDIDKQWDRVKELRRHRPGESLTLGGYTFSDNEDLENEAMPSACPPPLPGHGGIPSFAPVPPPPPGIPPPPPGPPGPPPPNLPPPLLKSPAATANKPYTGRTSAASVSSQSEHAKKTIRLHWREVAAEQPLFTRQKGASEPFKTLWQQVPSIQVDADLVQALFEVKQGGASYKKSSETKKELTVLDTKRSNAINIGLTVLPPVEIIKNSILIMDTNCIKREGIEKIITMIPTEEEKQKIREAQEKEKDIPLGRAEEFLKLLSSIDHLEARLKVWLFGSDFQSNIRELLEPLHDLKLAMKEIQESKTFKQIVSMLLTIGNILNESHAKSFHVEYLGKVTEVRDVINKNSLLFHVATFVANNFQNKSDLYSEISSIARCAKVDYDDLENKLKKLESDCEECRGYLSVLENRTGLPRKYVMCPRGLESFLLACREDVATLQAIHQIVMKRFRKFCAWLGLTLSQAASVNVHTICKTIAEFALEYKTTRGKIEQLEEKKRNRGERIDRRGKTIVETINRRSKMTNSPRSPDGWTPNRRVSPRNMEDGSITDSQAELTRHLLSPAMNSFPGQRMRTRAPCRLPMNSARSSGTDTDIGTDAGDEMIDRIVRTAVEPDREPRARKSTKLGERKSFRRKVQMPVFDEDRIRLPRPVSKSPSKR